MSEKPTYEELDKTVIGHKQTEDKLRESEERYRILFETMAQGVVYQDAEGKIISANSSAEKILGLSIEQMQGRTSIDPRWKSIHEDDSDFAGETHPSMVALKTGEKVKDVIMGVFNLQTERYRWININAVPQFREGEDSAYQVYTTLDDITERKEAEEALQESEEKYRSLTNNLNVGVFRNTIGPKGTSIEVNPAIFEMFGYDSRDEYLKVSVSDLYMNPDGRKKYNEKILRDGFVKNEELQLRKKDGTSLIGSVSAVAVKDEKGEVKYFDGILEDITERKQAEEELRESEEKYRILFEKANIGISVVQDGFVKSPNPKILDLHGYSEEEIISIPFINFIHPEDRELVQDRHERRIRGEELPTTYSYRILDKAGDAKWVELNVESILWEDKPATLCFLTDITNQKQAEEERKKLESQLQHAQKMESIGTLAGGIAHDINNILSPIMIHSEMAKMELPPDSPVQHNLKEIFKAGERATEMVKQILTFSRKTEGERAKIKIIPVLTEVLKMLRSSIPTTIDVQQNLESESETVLADPTQIHQIMLNLGTNAAHAMREKGGTLKVSLVREDLDSEAAALYTDLNPGSYLKLIVNDTGSGMDDETMQRIFEPYFTTKEVGEGTGMGLSLIHGIVKSYDGDITVESELGKGTTFNVYLPRIEADVSPVEEPSVQIRGGTERILFVDDEKVAVDAIQPMLEALGYKVTARTSSIETLEAFKNDPNGFDLVITDQTMPNMTGKDLAKEIMSIRSDIPIILCTGFSEQIDEVKAKEMGISFVMKPIILSQIANTIRKVLDKK